MTSRMIDYIEVIRRPGMPDVIREYYGITRLQIIAAMTAAIIIGLSAGLGVGFAFTHWFG